MMLSDVRDYVELLHLSEHTYMGKLDSKQDKSIGVYHGKRETPYKTAIGGSSLQSYGIKSVSFLVHWNKSPRDTENASNALFWALAEIREKSVNNVTIKFVQLLCDEPIDVGTDENGIYEMVIEAAIVYER